MVVREGYDGWKRQGILNCSVLIWSDPALEFVRVIPRKEPVEGFSVPLFPQ
jgi:hypothetical protein